MTVLWIYAAGPENPGVDFGAHPSLQVGVGKTACASRLTAAILRSRPSAVVSFGVAGVHRGPWVRALPLGVGDLCVVGSDRLVDEGVATPDGFVDLERLGLGDGSEWPADARLVESLCAQLGVAAVEGTTVSTCSGTDDLAAQRLARVPTGWIETMEGAAAAWVCAEHQIPWVGLRAISNFTGGRPLQAWDLPRAVARLGTAVRGLLAAGWP